MSDTTLPEKDPVDRALAAIRRLRKLGRRAPTQKLAMECQKKVIELATLVVEINNEKLRANSAAYAALVKKLDAATADLLAIDEELQDTTKALHSASQLLTALNNIVDAIDDDDD